MSEHGIESDRWLDPIDPYESDDVVFIPLEDAGIDSEVLARLVSRGLDAQCYRLRTDVPGSIRLNYAVLPNTIASRVCEALKADEIDHERAFLFVQEARYEANEATFMTRWSDFL